MRNKKVYEYWLRDLFNIIVAVALTGIFFIVTKGILDYLYRYFNIGLVNRIWYIWRLVKRTTWGGIFINISFFVPFSLFYFKITYRKKGEWLDIIRQTKVMANGNLDTKIETAANGDVKELADNINHIAVQLKKLIEEEKNAQQIKNELITNVSHDLRTPLTSIMGYLEIIDRDQYENEVYLRYYANIAYEKSQRLSMLINDLFELTKMQNNDIVLNMHTVNLVDLLGQLIAQFEYQLSKENMAYGINTTDERLIVKVDPEKLVRAFENLVSNAIKYGKEGKRIDIVIKRKEDMAIVQIINYGEPIPQIDLPHIFDRFYRVEKSRNSSIGGSGLGLAITKNIIELHEGKITATSNAERTVFKVCLPLEDLFNKNE
ncbi:MAG: sensor histidine kinase [Cellulosilyticaceae bacterium]